MKNIFFIKVILLILSAFLTASIFAACTSKSCTTTIDRLYASQSGVVYIDIKDSMNSLNCRPKNDVFISLKKDHPLFEQIYAMLLTVIATESEVQLRIVENSSDCTLAYAVLHAP